MRDLQADVAEFHQKFCQPVMTLPRLVPQSYVDFRAKLLVEEFGELMRAMLDDNLPEIADGLADLIYVALGTACVYGIDMEPIWEAVHRTNMAKECSEGTPPCETKPVKPEGWQPPDCAAILKAQERRMVPLKNLLLPRRSTNDER